jgi:hypothetical protein
MRTKLAVPTCRAVILGATLALAACAPASATQTSAQIPAKPAVEAAPVHGTVHIDIYSINSDGAYFRAVLSGSIGDYGPAVAVYPDGKVDPEHNSELELNLSRGTFRLNIVQLDREFFQHLSHYPDYPATCSEYVSFTTRVPVVADSGTGSYQGIAGDFTLSVTGNETLTSPGSCAKGPWTRLWEVLIFAGPGTVSS